MKRIRQSGLSLTELMIALALSLVLVVAAGAIFVSSRQTSRVGAAFAGIQENARYATQVIGYDLLNAGHMGCNPAGATVTTAGGTDADNLVYVGPVSGWSASKPAWIDTTKAGTDVLKIQYASPNAFHLTADMASAAAGTSITVSGGSGTLSAGPNVIADCASAEVFSFAAPPSGSPLSAKSSADLKKAYVANISEVMAFINHVYYVGTDSVLHRYTSTGKTIEDIADNVSDFAVLYGVDSSGDGTIDEYVTEPTKPVKSVQLCFVLANTESNVTIEAATAKYTDCHGVAQTNKGRTFHQVYRTTIALRNALN